ncbi:MAG TPA: hypothetical protein VF933_18210 [Streptosporangiaceae bacterium]
MTAGGGHAHDYALTATGRHRGRLAAVMAITLNVAHSTFQIEPAGHADHEPSVHD